LNEDNALLVAPTGTGKTEAVIFPVFNLLLNKRSLEKMRGISILYITPLRALNRDLLKRLTELGKAMDIKVQVRHGDTSPSARRLQALEPPDMLITTPETLQAIMPGRKMREHLRAVRWVIIDEIHELVSDERGVQLSLAVERLRILTGREFQRIGLSATI
jgi:ATP-dependent Lhr-like helicase